MAHLPAIVFDHKQSHPHQLKYSTPPVGMGFNCDVCNVARNLKESFRCNDCDFDMCIECFRVLYASQNPAAGSDVRVLRAHEHPLTFATGLGGRFQCDICNKQQLDTSFRCPKCDFDMCVECAKTDPEGPEWTTILARQPQVAPRMQYGDWQREFAREIGPPRWQPEPKAEPKAECPPFDYHAIHPHSLIPTSGLVGNRCDMCGEEPISLSYRCSRCDFDSCVRCTTGFRNGRTVSSVMDMPFKPMVHRHPLNLHHGLNKRFNCDVCRKSGLDESWRCIECDFDYCMECHAARRTEAAPKPTVDLSGLVVHPNHPRCPLRLAGNMSANHVCDVCNKSITSSARCDKHDFDACLDCMYKVVRGDSMRKASSSDSDSDDSSDSDSDDSATGDNVDFTLTDLLGPSVVHG